MTNNNNGVATTPTTPNTAAGPLSPAERFTAAVVKEFPSAGGTVHMTSFQKSLAQNYFIRIDMMLKEAERKRLATTYKQEPLPYTWENVNINKLAIDVHVYSSIGLDPTQANHLSPIPFKNNNTNKYDIGFIIGYIGLELKAKKYGYDVPTAVIVEVVYANDRFVPHKKDRSNPNDSYEFEIVKPFDRGEVVGGFWFHEFESNPAKNRLEIFSKKDIDKRKPKYASTEFWGGEKDVWGKDENGRNKKMGTETVEGWYDEMAYKTIARDAYNAIAIDSAKIDENYQAMLLKESELKDLRVEQTIQENANKKEMAFDDAEEVKPETPENGGIAETFQAPVNNFTAPPVADKAMGEKTPVTPAAQTLFANQDGPGF